MYLYIYLVYLDSESLSIGWKPWIVFFSRSSITKSTPTPPTNALWHHLMPKTFSPTYPFKKQLKFKYKMYIITPLLLLRPWKQTPSKNFSMPERHKFRSTTLQEKYKHQPTVSPWVLPLDLLYPNFTCPASKIKYLTQ